MVVERYALLGEKIAKSLRAEPSEVARDYGVVISGGPARVLKVRDESVCGSRCHRASHVALVVYPEVRHLAQRTARDLYDVRAPVREVAIGLYEARRAKCAKEFVFYPLQRIPSLFRKRILYAAAFSALGVFCRSRAHTLVAHGFHLLFEMRSALFVVLRRRPHRAQHRASRSRHRPLRRWGALVAELQRIAILPFGGCEMAGRRASRRASHAAVDECGAHDHRLRKRGAGVVKTEKGGFEIAHGEPRGADLVEQIAGKADVYAVRIAARKTDGSAHRLAVHLALRFFVGTLSPEVVGEHGVESVSEIAVALFGPHYGVRRAQVYRMFGKKALSSRSHILTL